ncbi:MAG TPA: glycogen-binding domain-containing protein [Anaerolineae bacterium]|nr:glycogen-binding domain-containing protein [Anaerolineae bacterium]
MAKTTKAKIKKKRITFTLNNPDAEEVVLMGDFNNWNNKEYRMKKYEGGVWKKMVMLTPGKCEYKFLVDGQWILDPNNDHKCSNCFGTYNNILVIP